MTRPPTPALAGCLIAKWGAVWLKHANGTRSFISEANQDCELKAEEVVDGGMDAIPKAHGGQGLYVLDGALSRLACQQSGCGSSKAVVAQSGSLSVPSNGWGMGVAPDWIDHASLRFNKAAQALFATLKLDVGQPLLLVFGGASVNDMLRNWAIHVKKLSLPYAIACMDEKLFDLADSYDLPGVMMIEKDAAGEKEVTTRWKYFRMDPAACKWPSLQWQHAKVAACKCCVCKCWSKRPSL